MRIAISAAAAVSGVVLLGLALYGQPAVYLHQAREQWDALMDRPSGDAAADPDAETGREREALLQREVLRLKEELAARRALEQQADSRPSSGPQTAPAPTAIAPTPASGNVPAVPAPALAPSGQAKPIPFQLSQSDPLPPSVSVQPSVPVEISVLPPRITSLPLPTPPAVPGPSGSLLAIPPTPPLAEGGRVPTPKPEDRRPSPPAGPRVAAASAPPAPTMLTPERREAGADTAPPKLDVAIPAKPDANKSDAAKPALSKPPVVKPIVLNPPSLSQPSLPQPSPLEPVPAQPPPRSNADNAQSILARIRQGTPDPAPAGQSGPSQQAALVQQPVPPQQAALPQQADPRPAPEVKPRNAFSSSVPRLNAARTALAGGRLDEARRLLQEAQLQLVFRPHDAASDDAPSAGRGAADVAHALEALSANDVPSSRQYIDIAIDDLTGNRSNAPVQDSGRRASGYAPAYPPR